MRRFSQRALAHQAVHRREGGGVGGAVQHAFRGVPAGRGILRARSTNTNVGTACACVSTMQGDVLVSAARSCNSKMIGSACQVVPRCRSGLTAEHPPRAGQAARLGVPGSSGTGCGANVNKMRAKVLDQDCMGGGCTVSTRSCCMLMRAGAHFCRAHMSVAALRRRLHDACCCDGKMRNDGGLSHLGHHGADADPRSRARGVRTMRGASGWSVCAGSSEMIYPACRMQRR